MTLLPKIQKRGFSLAEAAEYCGVSDKTLQRHGPEPSKIGDRTVYDRIALDRWMDGLLPGRGYATRRTSFWRRSVNERLRYVIRRGG